VTNLHTTYLEIPNSLDTFMPQIISEGPDLKVKYLERTLKVKRHSE